VSLVETETVARSALKALLDSEACISGASKFPSSEWALIVMADYGNTRQVRCGMRDMICRRSVSLHNGNETRLEVSSAMDRSRRSHNIVRKRTNLNKSRMISPCSGICEGESGLLVRDRGIEG
jgi:hypothetical protein